MTTAPVEPLRVLLVDDEPLARLRLRQLLAQIPLPASAVVGEAGDAAEATAVLGASPGCDLVLLDIALPGDDGLRIARQLRAREPAPAVVFVTAHGEHALEAFELDAADYLTKPVRRERLQQALERVRRRRHEAGDGGPAAAAEADERMMLRVSDRGRVLRIPATEMLYCKAEQKYVTLVTRGGQWLLDDALSDLEQRLGPAVLRIHRNALVALVAVRALERAAEQPASAQASGLGADHDGGDGWVVRLSSGETLAVSRRQVAAVREALRERG